MSRIDWSPLRRALRQCRAAGVTPRFWWRDDDAVDVTPALERLAAMADRLGLRVHLAVIPADATDTLATCCRSAPFLPVVHGWAHRDHSGGVNKKNEFQTPRDGLVGDAERGLDRLRALFGDDLRTMFVPPWNRINDQVITALPTLGFTALSTYGPRRTPEPVPGLTQINTHLDPIDWRGGGALLDENRLVAQAAAHFADRAAGHTDAAEPYGLLTHHLVHDPAIWAFAVEFMTELQMGGAHHWLMEAQK
ncbi:MAG: polysaccharide deacetylase family protein [Pseudomonadota bacterium]